MVMTSRRVHRSAESAEGANSTETTEKPEFEAVPALSGAPAAPHAHRPPATVREFYDWLPAMPHLKVEIINGRVIVSPRSNPEQAWCVTLLIEALLSVARRNGWRVWPELDTCIAGTREPLAPDLAMGPKDAPRWGEREILSDGLILVAEVVSPASRREDHEDKPLIYARGGVRLMLVVDPEDATITLHSRPSPDGYRTTTTVKMGDDLHIPDPVGIVLDTSVFLGD